MSERARRTVMIVEDETLVGMGMARQLADIGYAVVGQAVSSSEAMSMFDAHRPDIALIDIRLGEDDGIEVAKQLTAKRRVPMIIVSAHSDAATVARAAEAEVYGYLIKPPTNQSMAAQLEVAVRRFDDYEKLSLTLENRKLIEKAKGVLMKRAGLDEPAAHRKLQSESQKRRLGIVDLAKKIIETDSILGED